jgi:transposase
MAKELTVRELARMGGRARAKAYSKAQLRAWGKQGGRPPALSPKQIQRIAEWTHQEIGQEIIAQRLGVSVRTVGRHLHRLRFRKTERI